MAYLYQEIMNVSGLTGSSYQRQTQLYQKLGSPKGAYKGTTQQNLWLLGQVRSGKTGAPAPVAKPKKRAQVPGYLSNYQKIVKKAKKQAKSPLRTDAQIKKEIKKELEVEGGIPEAPSLVDLYEKKREEYGIEDLEAQINDLKGEEDEIHARLRQRRHAEEGKPVAMGVMAGRVSEVERQERENLDFVQRQMARKVDQVQAAYGAVEMIVNLTNTDFQNAMSVYNTQFKTKMAIYEQFRAVKKEELDEYHRQQEVARANLEIYTKLITDGNMTYDTLPTKAKLQIAKMEIQSGLGIGFVKKLRMKPGEDIKSITTRVDAGGNKYADIMRVSPDGKLTVEHQYLGKEWVASQHKAPSKPKKQTEAERKRSAAAEMDEWLSGRPKKGSKAAAGNYRTPAYVDFKKGLQAWTAQGYSASKYEQLFANKYRDQITWRAIQKYNPDEAKIFK